MGRLAFATIACFCSGTLVFCSPAPLSAQSTEDRVLAHARSLLQQGSVGEAEKELKTAAALHPNSFVIHNDLGTIYLQSHRSREALQEFSIAAHLNPNNADVQRNLGTCYFLDDDYSHAIRPLERAETLDPNELRTRYQLGYSLLMLARPREAESFLKFVSDRMPDDERAAFALIKVYQAERDQGRAASTFARLQEAHPDSVFVHILLGEADDFQGHSTDAVAEYQKAIEEAPDMPRLHFDMGFLYFKQEMTQKAAEAMQEEIHLNPSFAPALYYLGEIALEDNDQNRAIGFFQRALSESPSCLDAYIGLGKALASADRHRDAVAAFIRADRLNDKLPDVHYMLAGEYRQLHETEMQRLELEKFKILKADAKAETVSSGRTQDRQEGTTCLTNVDSRRKQSLETP